MNGSLQGLSVTVEIVKKFGGLTRGLIFAEVLKKEVAS